MAGAINESVPERWRRIPFGRPQSMSASGPFLKLELAISASGERAVISERQHPQRPRLAPLSAGQVGMFKDEVIELLKLLGEEFVLDALADIDG